MNRVGKRGLFVVLAILIGFLAAFNGSQAANPPDNPPALEERNEAVNPPVGQDEQERALVAELLDWDIRLEAARQEHERLTREIPVVQQALADAEADLAVTRVQLSADQDKLGRWVNFLYRYGPVTYLEVVLGATDFNDFVARVESVKIIIVSQIRLVDEVRTLQSRREEQVGSQRQAQADLTAKTAALSQKLADMDRDRAGREAFLAELRQQSTGLTDQVIQSETALYKALTSLRYLLSHLDGLPWYNLSPQTFSLSGRGLRMEFMDQEVNKIFLGQGDPNLASLSVQSSSGVFSISGRDGSGADYRLEGNFVLEKDGKVRFQPARVLLGGLPVSGEVLKYIASEQGLDIDLGDRTKGFRLKAIRPEEGKLVVELTS
ncbi:MAG: hypothetical protein PHT62_05880 [Desulfotomaculaceae bacterium]|nr:hypothetical protein [Desulfotomaculaceae bacterium]